MAIAPPPPARIEPASPPSPSSPAESRERALGLPSATALVIGSIIGTGVFTMPGVLAEGAAFRIAADLPAAGVIDEDEALTRAGGTSGQIHDTWPADKHRSARRATARTVPGVIGPHP